MAGLAFMIDLARLLSSPLLFFAEASLLIPPIFKDSHPPQEHSYYSKKPVNCRAFLRETFPQIK
jgi:hypothetical protein